MADIIDLTDCTLTAWFSVATPELASDRSGTAVLNSDKREPPDGPIRLGGFLLVVAER